MSGHYLPSPAFTTPFPDGLVESVDAPRQPMTGAGAEPTTRPMTQPTRPMTDLADPADRPRPLRRFLRTETAGAGLVLASVVVALVWANLPGAGYSAFWESPIAVRAGSWSGGVTLHQVVNEGLMAVFFLVVGLEARREFDLGALRERRKAAVPLVMGLAGMLVPVGIFLAVTHGST